MKGSKCASSTAVVEGSDVTVVPALSATLDILRAARGSDENGYRSEFISLVELTSGLTAKSEVGG